MTRGRVVALLIGLAASASAGAAERPGRALLQQGRALFERGDFQRSLRRLERAASAAREPAVLAQVHLYRGLNHAALRQGAAAERAFAAALKHDPTLTLDETRYHPEVVAAFSRARAALTQRVPTSRPSSGPTSRASPRPPASRPAIARARTRLLPVSPSSSPIAPGDDEREPFPRWPAWTAAAAAAISGGVALGLTLSAASDRGAACDLLGPASASCDDRREVQSAADLAEYRQLHSGIGDKSSAAVVLWVGAGVLAATSAVLFFLRHRAEGRRAARRSPASRLASFAIDLP